MDRQVVVRRRGATARQRLQPLRRPLPPHEPGAGEPPGSAGAAGGTGGDRGGDCGGGGGFAGGVEGCSLILDFVKISQVVEFPTGTRNPQRTPDEQFVYVDVAAVDNAEKKITGARYLSGAEAPSRARKVILTGDILVSTVRPNLNAVAVVPPEMNNQVASTGFCVLRPNAFVLPEYLFYFVRSRTFINGLTRMEAAPVSSTRANSYFVVRRSPVAIGMRHCAATLAISSGASGGVGSSNQSGS